MSAANLIATARRFTLDDQRRFAAMGGDWNPIHVDPVAARRSLIGHVVVHGMHLVMWSLDTLLTAQPGLSLARIEARFLKPVMLDEPINMYYDTVPEGLRLTLASEHAQHTTIVLALAPETSPDIPAQQAWPAPAERAPVNRPFSALAGLQSSHPVEAASTLQQTFPALVKHAGLDVAGGLLSLSTLVGMECPGLHSLFASATVVVKHDPQQTTLDYKVERAGNPIAPVDISVRTAGLEGQVRAFFRPAPPEPASYTEVRERVTPSEFTGRKILVVGGSRGLGAATAKLAAAGGADVAITYARGAGEAKAVETEIRNGGGLCRSLPLDVLSPDPALAILTGWGWHPNYLFYFATPRISGTAAALYSPETLARFMTFYCTSFEQLCRALSNGETALRVYYPSTVFLDAPPRGDVEYVMAKAAGEILCTALTKAEPRLRILVERLPRVSTDQTLTLLPARDLANPLDVMLPALRRMNEL